MSALSLKNWNSKLGYELYGLVEKLNPKKALVRLGTGECWTVSYSLLFLVMDGAINSIRNEPLCIEGEFTCVYPENFEFCS
jgi:hypothetical protein